jgi:WD40 repeat protein
LINIDLLLSGGVGGVVDVFDVTNYDSVKKIEAHSAAVNCLLPLPGGYFASGSDDNEIKNMELKWLQMLREYVKIL